MMKTNLFGCTNFQGELNAQNIPDLLLSAANAWVTSIQNEVVAVISNNTPDIFGAVLLFDILFYSIPSVLFCLWD
jgi:hypothetical protein